MSSPPRSKRRLSMVMPPISESSSVTLVNTPDGAGYRQLPTEELGRKRRKAVSFSPITHIIYSGPVDRSNTPREIAHQSYRPPVPTSRSHPLSQLLLEQLAVDQTSTPTSKMPPSNTSHRCLVSSMARHSQYSDFPYDNGLATNSNNRHSSILSVTRLNSHFPPDDATFCNPFPSQPPLSSSKDFTFVLGLPEPLHPYGSDGSHLSLSPTPRPHLLEQFSHQRGHRLRPLHITEHGGEPQLCPPSEIPPSHHEASFLPNHILFQYPSSITQSASSRPPLADARTYQARQYDYDRLIFDLPDSQSTQPEPCHHPQQSHQPTSVFVEPSTIHLPPYHIYPQVNNQVCTTFNYSPSDLVDHIRRREYVIRKRYFGASSQIQHCVTVLDMSVDRLFPVPSAIPSAPSPFASPQELFDIRPAFASLSSHSPGSSKHKYKSNALSKGLGMFALLPTPANSTIVVERPAFIVPHVMALSEEAFESALRMLDDETRSAIMDLATPPLTQAVKSVYDAIIKVNSLAIRLTAPSRGDSGSRGELETHKGIFLNASRINHSCSPNTKWEWDLRTLSLLVKSVRPILPGEEITISYVSPFLPYDLRRDAIFGAYSFHCVCASCIGLAGPLASTPEVVLDPDAEKKFLYRIEESDTARKLLVEFWDAAEKERPSFEQWCEDLSLPSDLLINSHMQALGLLHREGLEILDAHPGSYPATWSYPYLTNAHIRAHPLRDLGRHVDAIAMCFGALEDADNFRLWIGKAADARGFKLKAPSGHFISPASKGKDERSAFVRWVANPLSFPVWGWRTQVMKGASRSPAKSRDFLALGNVYASF